MAKQQEIQGQCLCGQVQVRATVSAPGVGACHCSACRTWGGGPFFALEDAQEVRFEGEEHITAYDSSLYGSLDGVIETISPDAIEDEKTGERFYNIKVRTSAESLESRRGDLQILPGMAAEVAVLNGKRSVLAYIIKPMTAVSEKALRDK